METINKGENPVKMTELERPISQSETEEFFGVSRQTLITWRKKQILKAHTVGGRVYYLKSELLETLKRVAV